MNDFFATPLILLRGKVRLPYPISANRYWRTFRNMTVVSKEAQAYKQEVAQRALAAGMARSGRMCALEVVLHPKLTKKREASLVCLDLDNCLKVTLDALKGVAYIDDKQVRRIAASYGEPVEGGALTVEVMELI